ncbi:hypothetical protein V8F33_003309 [Rhypophila sp. PSN 637]
MAASAALVSATEVDTGGVTINPDGSYTCAKANAAYCAGDSLKTDIIIRCYGTRGQPGRCSDNLAGQPPVGLSTALCHQTSNVEGDAACEKNCVVYGGSGNGKGTFTLPAEICTPTYTATSSSKATSTPVPTSTSTSSPSYPTTSVETSTSTETEYPHSSKTHTWGPYPPHSQKSYPHHTSKEDCTTETTVVVPTSYPVLTSETTVVVPTSYPTIITTTAYSTSVPYVHSSVIYPTNQTIVTTPTEPLTSGTAIPTGPTTVATTATTNPPVPAGAMRNSAAGGALAFVGFIAAYIL